MTPKKHKKQKTFNLSRKYKMQIKIGVHTIFQLTKLTNVVK